MGSKRLPAGAVVTVTHIMALRTTRPKNWAATVGPKTIVPLHWSKSATDRDGSANAVDR
jgi:hypothetical protein